ncbi:MAG: adenylate/guanylate cyclase domain-containing protein [Betaproteobacteria bacterium]|nr:adenylate/guanylate cyclase domain-containing protein [Betaproteobacteria bacterium]
MNTHLDDTLDSPYPLKSKFRRLVLPGLILLTLAIGLTMGKGSSWLTQRIYLQISENRAATIERALKEENAAEWNALQSSKSPHSIYKSPNGQLLLQTLRREVKELGLSHLKIYSDGGLIIFSSEEQQIGTFDPSDGYKAAVKGIRTLVEKKRPDATMLYELYVKIPDTEFNTVMELYEPVDYLDAISLQVILPAIILPVSVLLLLGWTMNRLVFNAQADIDHRTDLINEFRNRLQQLVSDEAVSSLRSSTGKGEVASRRIKATILFSDVRGFTDYCEAETPENVVSFLNKSLGIVINAVHHHSGDVDKMIGDAVLAYFQGDDAEVRALRAAQEALRDIIQAEHPRGVGIGIYSGDVVVGTIGTTDRMDFTIIGDTVNVASRLCSAAKEGEIVIDLNSYHAAKTETSQLSEKVHVKGKNKEIEVVRIAQFR